ncbi:MAG: Molybdopterin molybdenumtransferase [Alphaproteobacteria bacterium MarineAlpha9_Bin5]|nr:MAG: Molybdopterin molybdenumtransferase [Alphaproteobacteria bacterium MarineAlpha9_Bin6]PPR38973.1 MAG: Molybdopterin molybdenumtransferase [Alphaproteobacteria bacterium MarineAlpha9_Bin5]
MISVDEARTRILSSFEPLPPEDVGLDEALGRVLAQDVRARRTQPPTAISSMDGYAARSADLSEAPKVLKQVGKAPAGGAFSGVVGPNETVRIFTGGPIPDGADTIVIQENTESEGDRITVRVSAKAGQYIRNAGLDFNTGEVGLSSGKILTARDISLAAAMDFPWLTVYRKPRIAILATGDEVVRPGEPIGPNQIVSSNAIALQAFVKICGGTAINLGISPDKADTLRKMANGARGSDLLVTTGGISVGEHDLVRQALNSSGLKVDFWRVAMRPGKPVMYGQLGGVPVLGLPGNPVSVMVCALVFLSPVLNCLLGLPNDNGAVIEKAFLASPLSKNDRRQDYLRATLTRHKDGSLWAQPFERQDSSMISLLAKAQCLIIRVPNAAAADAGQTVEVMRFPSGLARL